MFEADVSPQVLPPRTLADEVIELHLFEVFEAGDSASRPPEAQFLCHVNEYRYSIHRLCDGLRVGRIHLRVTDEEVALRAVGHIGYAVDEPHRRNGYAVRAIQLVIGLARRYQMAPLLVLIEPDNAASRRTIEKVGFQFVDIVETSPEALGLGVGVGAQVCRYILQQP